MSVSYDVNSGFAFCDAPDFSDWCRELELARERWLAVVFEDHLPAWVCRKAYSKKPHEKAEAQSYLRQKGYKVVEDKENLTMAVMQGERLLSVFRVALQPPERTKCRFCGELLPPGFKGEVHKMCTIKEHLEALVSKANTVSVIKPG